MVKKVTLNDIAGMLTKQSKEIGDITDGLAFVAKRMATKDDIADVKKVKVNGIQNHLDAETLKRTDEKLPARVARVEKHLGLDKNVAA